MALTPRREEMKAEFIRVRGTWTGRLRVGDHDDAESPYPERS